MNRQKMVETMRMEFQDRIKAFAGDTSATSHSAPTPGDAVHPAHGRWEPAGTLGQPDIYVAVCLRNGDILAVAEAAYRYTGKTWTQAGKLPLVGVTAGNARVILLKQGTALTTGYDPTTTKFRGAVYDPSTNAWELTGDMNNPRRFYAAALLYNGQVLVAGGVHEPPILASAELYDPASRQWRYTASLNTARIDAAPAALHGGKAVLVIGGQGTDSTTGASQILNSVERYDASKAVPEWTVVKPMHLPRQGASAVVLPDGRVVVAGGNPNGDTLEVYDPVHDSWEDPVPLQYSRPYTPAIAVLKDGNVLIAGGGNSKVAEIYHPGKRKCVPTAAMTDERYFPGYCSAKDGSVIVLGGVNSTDFQPWNTAERFCLK